MTENKKTNIALLVLAAIGLIAVTATASAYLTKENLNGDKVAVTDTKPVKGYGTNKRVSSNEEIHWNNTQPAAGNPAPQRVRCDDGNIVGTVVGAAAGGLAGHQIGSGNGQTAATVAGVVGGAYLGNRYVPARGVTCR